MKNTAISIVVASFICVVAHPAQASRYTGSIFSGKPTTSAASGYNQCLAEELYDWITIGPITESGGFFEELGDIVKHCKEHYPT